MKQYGIWAQLLLKRLLRKPFFWLTLFLIPFSVFLLQICFHPEDSAISVAISTEETHPATPLTKQVLEQLTEQSNTLITFSLCDSPKAVKNEILSGRAACGYVLPSDLEAALKQHEATGQPVIHSFTAKGSFVSSLMDEYLYGAIYDRFCFAILDAYFTEKLNLQDTEQLERYYQEQKFDASFFTFSYADGSENVMLNQTNPNYMLLPIRGLASIFVLLTTMMGALLWYEDRDANLFCWLSAKRQTMVSYLYLALPAILAGILMFASIRMTDIQTSLGNELGCLLLFLFAIVGFCLFLQALLPAHSLYLATIPFLVSGSMLFSPVFIDLAEYSSICSLLSGCFPTTYYLHAIHSSEGKLHLLLFGAFFTAIGLWAIKIRTPKGSKTL